MTTQVLQLLFQEELARAQLHADHLLVSVAERDQWHAQLHTLGRQFELGCTFHGGFYCRQITASGAPLSYVPADVPPIRDAPGPLVRSGLRLIISAMRERNGEPLKRAVL